jgi:hypothetical protein
MKPRRIMGMALKQIPGVILAALVTACGGCGSPPPPAPMPRPMPPPMPVAPMPQAGPCDQAQSLATSTSMQARAAAEAPGMKPEGAPICGVVAEGQTVVSPMFILEPGACYTFLGQSLPPVGQMEMILQFDATSAAGPFLPPAMAGMAGMAQSTLLVTTAPGERVSMADRQTCYRWGFLMPATVKLVLKARAGSGPVAAQVFKKKVQ